MTQPSKRHRAVMLGMLALLALGALAAFAPDGKTSDAVEGIASSLSFLLMTYVTGESARPSGSAASVLADLKKKDTP